MSEHTKGPWKFRADGRTGDCGICADGTGIFVEAFAEIRHAGENAREEALANARLIAAAPDLLDVCREFLSVIGPEGYYPTAGKTATDRMRAAIVKAEGRS